MSGRGPIRVPQVQPWLDEQEAAAVHRVVAGNWISEGPEAEALVAELNELVGARFGVLAPNGTLALALGLLALGIGTGDEVLVPDITFIGSATAVVLTGARPVFVDVDPENFQIDVAAAERHVSPRTRAVMPVHLYGTACDMDAVAGFAGRHGLRIIEDAAQGIAVAYRGRHVGAIGDVGCFSFFADKTITMGEGGYVACQDPEIYERLRVLRNQGRRDRGSFRHPEIGFNFRITEMQAALGRVQIAKLGRIIELKAERHSLYCRRLAPLAGLRVLTAAKDANLVPFRCVLIGDRVPELADFLERNGVQTRSFFYPLHRQPCFASQMPPGACRDGEFPNAIAGYERGLCLPVHPGLTLEQADYAAGLVYRFYAEHLESLPG